MKSITSKEFNQLVDFIKLNYGVNLIQKKTLVVGRLHNYLSQNNYNSFSDYLEYVMNDRTGNEVAVLITKLTTNHTFFMREQEHFTYFKNTVLPYLEKTEYLDKDLRIWSAGCSTGEEPYTLAMILADYFGQEKSRWDSKILATDISTKCLDSALKGIYSNDRLNSIPENWRRAYFNKIDYENSVIKDKMKKEVILRKFNLMNRTFPFKKKFHVIFCRNVMIYFDAATKKALVDKFYEYTEKGGYLFIGHSESLNREETKYKYVMPAVYRKE